MGTDRTAAGAADPYAALAAELRLLGMRLDRLGAELLRLRAADGSGAPGTEGFPGAPGRPADLPAGTGAPVAQERPGPWGTGGSPQAPADPGGGPRAPRSQLSGARGLGRRGGGVSLLGVVRLLALAGSRGC
jgi:hypothetical protein